MKTLAQYLAEYLNQEILDYDRREYENPQDNYFGETELRGWIEQGIEAYQSIETCKVLIFMNAGDPKDCEHCRKCGTSTCGNDFAHCSCFEPIK